MRNLVLDQLMLKGSLNFAVWSKNVVCLIWAKIDRLILGLTDVLILTQLLSAWIDVLAMQIGIQLSPRLRLITFQ